MNDGTDAADRRERPEGQGFDGAPGDEPVGRGSRHERGCMSYTEDTLVQQTTADYLGSGWGSSISMRRKTTNFFACASCG